MPSKLPASRTSATAAATAAGRPVAAQASRKTDDISNTPVTSALTFRQVCTSRTGAGPVSDDRGGDQEVGPVVVDRLRGEIWIARGRGELAELRGQRRVPDEVRGEVGAVGNVALGVTLADAGKGRNGDCERQQKNATPAQCSRRRSSPAAPPSARRGGGPANHETATVTSQATCERGPRRHAPRRSAPRSPTRSARSRAARLRSSRRADAIRTARIPAAALAPPPARRSAGRADPRRRARRSAAARPIATTIARASALASCARALGRRTLGETRRAPRRAGCRRCRARGTGPRARTSAPPRLRRHEQAHERDLRRPEAVDRDRNLHDQHDHRNERRNRSAAAGRSRARARGTTPAGPRITCTSDRHRQHAQQLDDDVARSGARRRSAPR